MATQLAKNGEKSPIGNEWGASGIWPHALIFNVLHHLQPLPDQAYIHVETSFKL